MATYREHLKRIACEKLSNRVSKRFTGGGYRDVFRDFIFNRVARHAQLFSARNTFVSVFSGPSHIRLDAPEALERLPHLSGAQLLWERLQRGDIEKDGWRELHEYFRMLKNWNPNPELPPGYVSRSRKSLVPNLYQYPGMVEVLRHYANPEDRIVCLEDNLQDLATLNALAATDSRIKVLQGSFSDPHLRRGALPPLTKTGVSIFDLPDYVNPADPTLLGDISEGLKQWPHGIHLIFYRRQDPRHVVHTSFDRYLVEFQRMLLKASMQLGGANLKLPIVQFVDQMKQKFPGLEISRKQEYQLQLAAKRYSWDGNEDELHRTIFGVFSVPHPRDHMPDLLHYSSDHANTDPALRGSPWNDSERPFGLYEALVRLGFRDVLGLEMALDQDGLEFELYDDLQDRHYLSQRQPKPSFGVAIVNPPPVFYLQMQELLPQLAKYLNFGDSQLPLSAYSDVFYATPSFEPHSVHPYIPEFGYTHTDYDRRMLERKHDLLKLRKRRIMKAAIERENHIPKDQAEMDLNLLWDEKSVELLPDWYYDKRLQEFHTKMAEEDLERKLLMQRLIRLKGHVASIHELFDRPWTEPYYTGDTQSVMWLRRRIRKLEKLRSSQLRGRDPAEGRRGKPQIQVEHERLAPVMAARDKVDEERLRRLSLMQGNKARVEAILNSV